MEIVIDKSFLEGASASEFQALCSDYKVLFIESLFYELLTTKEEKRIRCFKKFPPGDAPVFRVPCIGTLLRYEIMHKSPAGSPWTHRIEKPFSFNRGLCLPGYRPPQDQVHALEEWSAEVDKRVSEHHDLATALVSRYPEIGACNDEVRRAKCSNLKEKATTGSALVLDFYRLLPLEEFPKSSLLTPEWALFRRLQAMILFSFDHLARYGLPYPGTPKNIEHEVHDFEYVTFGALAGAVATRDKKLAENFKLMVPNGVLFD